MFVAFLWLFSNGKSGCCESDMCIFLKYVKNGVSDNIT